MDRVVEGVDRVGGVHQIEAHPALPSMPHPWTSYPPLSYAAVGAEGGRKLPSDDRLGTFPG